MQVFTSHITLFVHARSLQTWDVFLHNYFQSSAEWKLSEGNWGFRNYEPIKIVPINRLWALEVPWYQTCLGHSYPEPLSRGTSFKQRRFSTTTPSPSADTPISSYPFLLIPGKRKTSDCFSFLLGSILKIGFQTFFVRPVALVQ